MMIQQRLLITAVGLLSLNASATLYVYEGFDYAPGTINGSSGYSGGDGFSNDWQGSTSNIPFSMADASSYSHGGVHDPGLEFTGLTTVGNVSLTRTSAPGAGEVNRTLNGTAITGLTQDNSTIYFSVLVRPRFYSIGNENFTFAFGTSAFSDPNPKPPTMTGGEAFGFIMSGYNNGNDESIDFHAYQVDGGSPSISAAELDNPPRTSITYMILGQIDWVANGGNDTLSLYNILDVNAPLPPAFATLSADLDQALFDTIAIGSAQVSSLDEIRFGSELSDVGIASAVPEPSSCVLMGLGLLGGLLCRRFL